MSEAISHPILPPRWATAFGTDRFGIWAEFAVAKVKFRMRWIPPGRFLMGSPDEELGRYSDEGPFHWVRISSGFWMGENPVTQEQWMAVAGKDNNPSNFSGENLRPVDSVSWQDCQQWMEDLQKRVSDLKVDFPTEAQWEYACRAGRRKGAFHNGLDCTEPEGADPALEQVGWYSRNSQGSTHPVKELDPNRWGLYDMHGNVWEWCRDSALREYGATEGVVVNPIGEEPGARRVVRGGSWAFDPGGCRSAYRLRRLTGFRFRAQGFRLCSGQPPEAEIKSAPEDQDVRAKRPS